MGLNMERDEVIGNFFTQNSFRAMREKDQDRIQFHILRVHGVPDEEGRYLSQGAGS